MIVVVAASGLLRAYGQSKPIVSSELTQSDQLAKYVKPRCPKGLHLERPGKVRMGAVIKTDGVLREVEFEEGDPRLRAAALKAVRSWRYKPVFVQGTKVEVKTTIELEFSCP
jgi:outer membrane biosynthesis protein TonB